MDILSHTTVASINLAAIQHNYKLLCQLQCKDNLSAKNTDASVFSFPNIMPVVKADAYGHGGLKVATALASCGATAFASGNISESVSLRMGLLASGYAPKIVSLLGPVTCAEFILAAEHGVVPVIHCREQLDFVCDAAKDAFVAMKRSKAIYVRDGIAFGAIPVAIKCNSGMSRLGFNEEEIAEVLDIFQSCHLLQPVLLLSHLATADSEAGPNDVEAQLQVFARIFSAFRTRYPLMPSLCNSAGTIFSSSSLPIARQIDSLLGEQVCRPGLALYGGNPFRGTSFAYLGDKVRPAMHVHTPIISLRTLKAGKAIGYGLTWKNADFSVETPIAIIAIGYADALSRSLTNKGEVCLHGVRVPIVGRISMQMTALDLTPLYAAGKSASLGDSVYIVGGQGENAITADELADCWGTISYEVMCLLGMNRREYR